MLQMVLVYVRRAGFNCCGLRKHLHW